MRTEERPGRSPVRGQILMLLAAVMVLSGCAGGEKGLSCQGSASTLEGRPLEGVEGTVVDRFNSFRAEFDDTTVESGPLQSRDPQQYIPSAVSSNGWLAQRLSDTRFSVINAQQNKMVTFSCPNRAI